ncbi:SHOCT domain-containing protein [Pseudonocardia endophytica]|uniref:SHOCT domain-containing protein n=1 Tax=Pseudonocardia endophytica TaxID=401976 RepID=UPI001A9DA881|nr:SHOCT domain-containing protein [Pseudonocardia endophytica]
MTNARLVAFNSVDIDAKGIKRFVHADDIARIEVVKKTLTPNNLTVTTRSGEQISFGDIPGPDLDLVLGAAQQLGVSGAAPDARRAMAHQAADDRRSTDAWAQVPVVGTAPSDKAWKALKDHCSPGELPIFVIGSGTGGVFAALPDRAMIIKVGAMTSMMAGSLGGGRVTTFPFSEITGIEYNAGFVNGVLEVLTPSYSGTANKDYWRGSNKGRNADSNDPWTLSNCLPLPKPVYQQALPRLNEMRAHIAQLKRPTVVVQQQPSNGSAPSVADELGKLAGLRDQGILSDAEFQAAKQRVLAQHGMG